MITSRPDDFPWPPAPRDTLSDATSSYINDTAVAVLFVDKLTSDATEVVSRANLSLLSVQPAFCDL